MATINGTSGSDKITPTSVSAGVTGGFPSNSADIINALAGNDTIDGGGGVDQMNGGPGSDVYHVDTNDVLIEGINEGTENVNSTASSYMLAANVERLTLIGLAVEGIGNSGNNAITGNSANNSITGNAGDDSLSGGGGNDTLDGGAGYDSLFGGSGNDTYIVDHGIPLRVTHYDDYGRPSSYEDIPGDRVDEASGAGTDTIIIDPTYTGGGSFTNEYSLEWAGNVENLTLSGAAVNGTGNSKSNSITGSAVNNVLRGLDGNDTLVGGAGNDTLAGGSGSDILVFTAGDANDQILDYEDGRDKIKLASLGLSFADLDISVVGSNTVIDLSADVTNAGTITIVNVTSGIESSDFLFS